MTTTGTTTDYAAEIRATLKARHGWNARQVSVRASYYSMGSSIDVTIKDPAISLPTVKAIAEGAEHIRRCEATGEILGGGNRYVSVRYSHEAQEILGRRYADAVQRAVNTLTVGSNALAQVEGTEYLVGVPHEGRITIWNSTRYLTESYTVDYAAQIIGQNIHK